MKSSNGVGEIGRYKILNVPLEPDWAYHVVPITLENTGSLHVVQVDNAWLIRHKPKPGGYLISYTDGTYGYSQGDVTINVPVDKGDPVTTESMLARIFGFGDALPQKISIDFLRTQVTNKTFEIRSDGRTTLCELTMKNGATYRGESTCAVAAEFVASDGEFYAEKEAVNKAWSFYGILLRELRFRAGLS